MHVDANREDWNQSVNLVQLEHAFHAYRFFGSDYTDAHAVLSLYSTYMYIAHFAYYDLLFIKLLLRLICYVVGSSVCARLYVCA